MSEATLVAFYFYNRRFLTWEDYSPKRKLPGNLTLPNPAKCLVQVPRRQLGGSTGAGYRLCKLNFFDIFHH